MHRELVQFGNFCIKVDSVRTASTYAQFTQGGTQSCSCIYCENYAMASKEFLPLALRRLMQQLSIDPSKDAEVYVLDTIDDQRLIYADEYYFFGDVIARTQVVEKSAFPQDGTQLEIDIRAPSPLAQEEFKQEGALCLYFEVELPCVRSANS